MKKVNFTAFDFETATYDRMPCQLGLVVIREGQIIEEKKFLIKPPENKYDSGCSKVHKITDKDTNLCPEFHEIWEEIKPYFDHELMVGHNVDFDTDVLDRVISYYRLEKARPLCFCCTSKIFYNRSLEDVTEALAIKMEKHHDALSDAKACAQIYLKYLSGIDPDELSYSNQKPKESFYKNSFDANRTISHEAKVQDLSIVENPNNLFYDKKIVISGVFDNFPVREDLALLLKKYGADINGSISKKTDFFIIGSDYGPSKMKKVEILQSEGYGIKIMDEDDLMNGLININCK
jgi:DNA polymerase-3 subunit epsilon